MVENHSMQGPSINIFCWSLLTAKPKLWCSYLLLWKNSQNHTGIIWKGLWQFSEAGCGKVKTQNHKQPYSVMDRTSAEVNHASLVFWSEQIVMLDYVWWKIYSIRSHYIQAIWYICNLDFTQNLSVNDFKPNIMSVISLYKEWLRLSLLNDLIYFCHVLNGSFVLRFAAVRLYKGI